MPASPGSLLQVRNLVKHFPGSRSGETIHAVNGVSFDLAAGETLGLVGESGSGKTTIGRAVIKLLTPTGGTICFDGADITALSPQQARPLRSHMQIVFQDPYGALNPRMRVRNLIGELLQLHTTFDPVQRLAEVRTLADKVRLSEELLDRFPHELSGGQLQRVCIARAIATKPKLIVLDEPTSSLDLSVRAGILALLRELQRATGVAMLFISHDLDTVRLVSDRILVLYLGSVVEAGPAEAIFARPVHPYTQVLLSAHLPPDPDATIARRVVRGEAPSAINLPVGCPFAPRCPIALDKCATMRPDLAEEAAPGHRAACLRVADGSYRLPSEPQRSSVHPQPESRPAT
ncbi:MAG: ABC transporter ATP-binding protein [Alphaproteobacteria bacterium]|nr:ABC transporter ATP-binding protein [Alphaproteobacteria bacterium]